MATTTKEAIELVARTMMREVIERSGWYPHLQGEKRRKCIEADVDLNWHLMVSDARKRLEAAIVGAETVQGTAK